MSSLFSAAGGIVEGAYAMKAAGIMDDALKGAEANQNFNLDLYHRSLDFATELKGRYGGRLEDAYQDMKRISQMNQEGPDALVAQPGGSLMPGGGGGGVEDTTTTDYAYAQDRSSAMFGFASDRFNQAQQVENAYRGDVTANLSELNQIIAARGAAKAQRRLAQGRMIENSTILGWKVLELIVGGAVGAATTGGMGDGASPSVANGSEGAGGIGGGSSAPVTGNTVGA